MPGKIATRMCVTTRYRLVASSRDEQLSPGVVEDARPGKNYTLKLSRAETFEILIQML